MGARADSTRRRFLCICRLVPSAARSTGCNSATSVMVRPGNGGLSGSGFRLLESTHRPAVAIVFPDDPHGGRCLRRTLSLGPNRHSTSLGCRADGQCDVTASRELALLPSLPSPKTLVRFPTGPQFSDHVWPIALVPSRPFNRL